MDILIAEDVLLRSFVMFAYVCLALRFNLICMNLRFEAKAGLVECVRDVLFSLIKFGNLSLVLCDFEIDYVRVMSFGCFEIASFVFDITVRSKFQYLLFIYMMKYKAFINIAIID